MTVLKLLICFLSTLLNYVISLGADFANFFLDTGQNWGVVLEK